MNEEELKTNFTNVVKILKDDGMKITNISKALGYTTTTQLAVATVGPGLPSSKAIIAMVKNLKVNPLYLFLGEGRIFLQDEPDEIKLKDLNKQLKIKLQNCEDEIKEKEKTIQKLLQRQEDLLELLIKSKVHPESNEEQNPAD